MCTQGTAALAVALLFVSLGVGRASGEPGSTGPVDEFTLASAARAALGRNPDRRAAVQAIEAARARLVQAGLWSNPELKLSLDDDFAFEGEGERTVSAGFAQRFPIAGRLGRARQVAQVDIERAQSELRDFDRTLIGEVRRSAVTLLERDRGITEQHTVIDAARTLVEASVARFRVAEVSEADVNLLETELDRFEQDLRLQELERRTEAMRLNRLIDRSPERPIAIRGDLGVSLLPASLGTEVRESALALRPDLQGLRLDWQRSQAQVELAEAEAWEDWTVEARYEYIRDPFVRPIGIHKDQTLGIGVSIPFPLFNRNQGLVAEARADGRRAKARATALERLVAMEVEAELLRVEELDRIAVEYRDRMIPRATRNVGLLEKGYREGLVAIAQLVQAEQQYADSTLRYVRTLGELRRAEIDLETAAAASPLLTANIEPSDQGDQP